MIPATLAPEKGGDPLVGRIARIIPAALARSFRHTKRGDPLAGRIAGIIPAAARSYVHTNETNRCYNIRISAYVLSQKGMSNNSP